MRRRRWGPGGNTPVLLFLPRSTVLAAFGHKYNRYKRENRAIHDNFAAVFPVVQATTTQFIMINVLEKKG